jgi:hypothetical protein
MISPLVYGDSKMTLTVFCHYQEFCQGDHLKATQVQEYIASLNADQDLHQSLAMIVNNKSGYFQGLNDKEQRFRTTFGTVSKDSYSRLAYRYIF